jgi:putative PIN family toxin of toxin-antitoxin system
VIRVVLDPNVIVSAAIGRDGASPPSQTIRLWYEGAIEVVVSPTLLSELSAVLARPKLRRYVTPAEAERIVASLQAEALIVPDPAPEPGLTADPRDDYLVALARAAGVTALVSGDRHLTELDDPRPPVWTPRMLVERVG